MQYKKGDKVIILNWDYNHNPIVEGLAELIKDSGLHPANYPRWQVVFLIDKYHRAVTRTIYPTEDIYDFIIKIQHDIDNLHCQIRGLKLNLNERYGRVDP